MANDPNDTGAGKGDPKPSPKNDDELGDGGKRALDAERRRANEAERKIADLQRQIDDAGNKDKTEMQKLEARLAAAEAKSAESDARIMRFEVATRKGLTEAQARRLVGTSKEELEADADELLETFGKKPDEGKDDERNGTAKAPPSNRPRPNLSGGSEPAGNQEPEEMDPRKLAGMIPRS